MHHFKFARRVVTADTIKHDHIELATLTIHLAKLDMHTTGLSFEVSLTASCIIYKYIRDCIKSRRQDWDHKAYHKAPSAIYRAVVHI